MKHPRLEPAAGVIAKMGGAAVVSTVTGKNLSSVYRWMMPLEAGGTGGVIPASEAQKLLDYATANGIDLSPADFFLPAPAPQVEALEGPLP